jgi:hypothetical protein
MARTIRPSRLALIAAVAILALSLAGVLGYRLAASSLESRIVAALGPDAEVGAISLRLGHVEIVDLRVRAPEGWPTNETLSARRVVVVPELRTLLSNRVRIARVTIEDATLSALRTGDGRVRVLPRLVERAAAGAGESGDAAKPGARPAPTPAVPPADGAPPRDTVLIGRIVLHGGTLAFFDASLGRAPHEIRLTGVEAELGDLALPSMSTRSQVRLTGAVQPARAGAAAGHLQIEGWLVAGTRDSSLRTRLRGMDLVALQPYLVRAADTAVRGGTIDLELDSTVDAGRLRAPGRIAIAGLQLAPGSRFMGVPREAVVRLLENRAGRIELAFTLDGRLDDPRFSVSEDLVARATAALVDRLGGSIGDVLRDAGGGGRRAVDALRGLFGR